MNEWMQLGRYRIEEYLGSGSYAIVYRAIDVLLNRQVALKVLKPIWTADAEVFARFGREARAAANLIHPHIAWVLDIGEAEGKHFLAIRYVDGLALDKYMQKQGPLAWNEAVRIVEQVGSALDFAHRQNMVHRDLKPQNILISASEGAVLTDFGLVKPLLENSQLTYAGAIVGTPQYIAPEIWRSQPASPASDQYALACVFIEMLTGKIMFEGALLETIIQKHLKAEHIIENLPAGLPAGLQAVLQRALAKEPAERFPNLAALVAALQALETPGELNLTTTTTHAPELTSPAGVPREVPSRPAPDTVHTGSLGNGSGQPPASASAGEWRRRLSSLYTRLASTGSLRPNRPEYELVLVDDQGPLQRIALTQPEITIGRSRLGDIVVEDPDVSRQHARLLQTQAGYKIQDLRSTNGTFVNGQRVTGELALHNGDEVVLGRRTRFKFISAATAG